MDTNFRGPLANMGAMEDSPSNVQPLDGPVYSYQGGAIADIRGGAYQKDNFGPGRVPAIFDNPTVVVVNNVPSAVSTTRLSAATAMVEGTAVTLVTVAPGGGAAGVPSLAPAVPFIPFGATSVANGTALDFGFTTGTTSAGSGSVLVSDTSLFTPGQWLVVGGAGNSGKTASLVTKVASVAATSIVVSPVALGTLANAPIGSANLFNPFTPPATQFGPAAVSANAWTPHLAGGLLRMQNPAEMLARCVSVSPTGTTNLGGAFLVTGWDVYGQAMTETITVTAETTAVAYGKKAFKLISNVVPQFTDTATYSIGVGDTFGFPFRQDRWETADIMFGGTRVITNVGWLGPDLTNPATATTGDVRGTVQLSTSGAATAVASPVAGTTDGVKRLVLVQSLPLWNMINATPLNTVPLYGQTNA